MKNTVFKGAATALITPMNDDMSVNYTKLAEITEYQIKNGIDALIPCGTTGESCALLDDERLGVIETTIKAAKGRVPVIAGTGCNNTAHSIKMSKAAEKLGADALLLVTPYYNKTSQEGLVHHYFAIADSVDIPVILYNVPSRTGVKIEPDTYKRLGDHKNIVAVKEASSDISLISSVAALCSDALDIYAGNDDQIIPILSLGGIGCVSVLSHLLPKECHDMCYEYFASNVEAARRIQLECIDLVHALFCDVSPICIKEAMNQIGWNVGKCRLPLFETSQKNKERISKALSDMGISK